MKKRIQRLFCTAAFLVCFALLFLRVSEIMREKTGGKIDMIHSFYSLERNSLDVIVLGSSHAYYGFQPNVLWKEQGITSYVMGSPEQSVASSWFLLKEALKYQKPKVVLLESYYVSVDVLYSNEARIRQAFDGMRMGKVKKEMVETFLPERSFKEKMSYYLPFLMYHNRWDSLKETDFYSKLYLKGSKPSGKTLPCPERGMDIPEQPIPAVNREYLDKIMELCRKENIELVLFATPYVLKTEKAYAGRQGVNLTLENYLQEKGIPFLFYQKTGEADIDYAEDFKDVTHLNTKGQKKISRAVGKYLAENCGLKGHKGEPGYESWDRDYALYKEDIK